MGDAEATRRMERAMFQFGAGAHICLGHHIALMEVYKLVPSIPRSFLFLFFFFFFLESELFGSLSPLLSTYVLLDFPRRAREGMDHHPGREREADGRLRADEEAE